VSAPVTIIAVADVEPATAPLPEVPYHVAVDARVTPPASADRRNRFVAGPYGLIDAADSPVEACSDARGTLAAAPDFHAGMAAIHLAFVDHRPLVLSPDIVWLFLAQGFAHHVSAHAEALRRSFVRHAGTLEIEVRRDEFVKGSADNDWAGVVAELAATVREHMTADAQDLLISEFSTTGLVERVACQVAMLDAMQSYFDYSLWTLCGIPRVVLEGTAADWERLVTAAARLGRYGLEWWMEPLLPVLDQFVAAVRGDVDVSFWRSIYKHEHMSGSDSVTGWITTLMPYLQDRRTGGAGVRNEYLDWGPRLGDDFDGGLSWLSTDQFPSGLARAPFKWRILERRTSDMELVAGFVGVRQDRETLAVRPEIGWAVIDPTRIAAIVERRRQRLPELHRQWEADRDERQRLDAERSKAWRRKGMCPQCGLWRYVYGEDRDPACCGAPCVNVTVREGVATHGT